MATVSRVELIQMITAAGFGLRPAEMLPRIGGVEAVPDLIDLLQNEPDPLTGDQVLAFALEFRKSVIRLLAELRDRRAVAPLMGCYETYRLLEDLLIHMLETRGVSVPARLDSYKLIDLLKQQGDYSFRDCPDYPDYARRISATHLKAHLGSDTLTLALLGSSWVVRSQALLALDQIDREAGREFFARVLQRERNDAVRKTAALSLGRLKDPLAIEDLGNYLQHQIHASAWVEDSINEAIDALAEIPDERARQALRDFYDHCPRSISESKQRAGWRLGLNPEPKTSKSGCFIATAVCGSPGAPDVLFLREFRNRHLLRHGAGTAFVRLYELLSPGLADFIRTRAWCRRAVRFLLIRPLVASIRRFRPMGQGKG